MTANLSASAVLYYSLAAIVSRFVLVSIYRLFFHPLASYPGPWLAKITDFYAAWHAMTGNLHLAMKHSHDTYGPRIRFGPNKLLVNDATDFVAIYNSPSVRRGRGFSLLTPTPGKFNLISTINKKDHRRKRRILSAAFSDSAWRRFEPEIHKTVDIFLNKVMEGYRSNGAQWSQSRNMANLCRFLAFDIIGKYAFGYSFHSLEKRDKRFFLDVLSVNHLRTSVYVQYPALEKLKLEIFYPRIIRMRGEFFGLTADVAKWRLSVGKEAEPDVFSFVSNAIDIETGERASFEELWAESTFMVAAGLDTIASTLCAVFFYLANYPAAHDRLVKEVCQLDDLGAFTRCVYLEACVREAMRMNPPIGSAPWREVEAAGLQLGDAYIPAGIDVGTSLYALQHSAHLFPEPFKFQPERWIGPDGKLVDQPGFVAFGAGPGRCLGRAFAIRELHLIVAKTMRRCDIRQDLGSLGNIGGGQAGMGCGREDPKVFQLWDHITSSMDGPWLQFRERQAASAPS